MNLRNAALATVALAAALSTGCKPAPKAESTPAAATDVGTPEAAAAAETPSFDPDAKEALNRMGEALRAMEAFSLAADVTSEKVLVSGQKLQFDSTLNLEARRPGRFKLTTTSERGERQFFFDGKTVTMFAPRKGFYATVPAPAEAGPALAMLKEKYGVETPLADLFYWGTDSSTTEGITSGFSVGTETIEGQACEHFALRQGDVDWQVWIRSEGAALPCKLVITTTDDPSMPQYSAVFHWKPGKAPGDAAFSFSPPAGAHPITIAEQTAPAPPAPAAK